MYIRNKKTGLVQECHNKDVIQVYRKDPEHFEVLEKDPKAELTESSGEADAFGHNTHLSEMGVKELRSFAKENGIEGAAALNKEELLEVLKDVV